MIKLLELTYFWLRENFALPIDYVKGPNVFEIYHSIFLYLTKKNQN
jgi:hypothetical protein